MSSYNYSVFGLKFARATATSRGLTTAEKNADNSVERELYTSNGTSSGNLSFEVSRAAGIHTSVSTLEAPGSLGPSETQTERKAFWLDSDRVKTSSFADWNIFNASGLAVGASNGTTDTDSTPAAGWNVDL